MKKTTKFFVLFLLFTVVILVLYLTLNLLPYLWEGITAIPIAIYIVYLVGSVIALMAVIAVYRKISTKLFIGIAIWLAVSLLLVVVASVIINWITIFSVLQRILPVETIVGFLICFIFMILSGAFSGLFKRKSENNKVSKNNNDSKS